MTKNQIANAFLEAGLPYDKICKSKLGGFYIYHRHGAENSYRRYTVVSNTADNVTKLRERVPIKRSFVDNENMLRMTIAEAKLRSKYQ